MTHDAGLLDQPYRVVRAVRADQDGPWPGTLVRTPSGASIVLVDENMLGDRWTGWRFGGGGHVIGPLDLVRRTDGHSVAVPACAERLDEFLRRRVAGAPLSPGEAVTLGVSLVRGCAELVDSPEVTGEWWLDGAGMPVLATETSAQEARHGAAAALADVPVDVSLGGAWEDAIAAVTADRMAKRQLIEAEDALFQAAMPEPLITTSLSPRGAAEMRTRVRAADPAPEAPPRSVWQTLIRHVDTDLADAVSRATTAVWRRWRAPRRSRRAPWLVAGGAAAAVLVGGALWPSAGGVATTPDPAPSPPGAPAPLMGGETTADEVVARPPAGEATTATLDAVATMLLDRRLACDGRRSCLAEVVADPSAVFPEGAVDLNTSSRAVTLLDDFGGVAVVRVDAADGSRTSQLVVLTQRDDTWLLRDVQDVAQQP